MARGTRTSRARKKTRTWPKFSEAYRSPGGAHYQPGVGTRFGHLGRLIGGITGAGARTRVERALAKARTNIGGGDTTVDIVGFSRGAALAVEFAYRLFREGGTKPAAIRFLGLWDCVPSFGIPGNEKNVGWHLNNVADNVGQCFHALALDERRGSFPLNRLAARVDSRRPDGSSVRGMVSRRPLRHRRRQSQRRAL